MATKRVIALLGQPIVHDDRAAAAAITPGHLVEYSGSGTMRVHSTAGGIAARLFALNREESGKDIDAAYAQGDQVKVGAFKQGDCVNALIASGQNLAEGAFLESAGNGTLRVFGSGQRLAVATESVNNSAGPGDARIRVQIV